MTPTYDIRAWRENDWWLAQVTSASPGADDSPVNAVTHARTMTLVEQAARDVITTILDVDEGAFEIDVEYVLPNDIETLVYAAIGARTWLDAAEELWREQSAVAVRALTDRGFSLRETAVVLGLPDRRVDQILRGSPDRRRR